MVAAGRWRRHIRFAPFVARRVKGAAIVAVAARRREEEVEWRGEEGLVVAAVL